MRTALGLARVFARETLALIHSNRQLGNLNTSRSRLKIVVMMVDAAFGGRRMGKSHPIALRSCVVVS